MSTTNRVFYYAVWKGRRTGIFDNWEQTSESVINYKGCKYKKYKTLAEAQDSMQRSGIENYDFYLKYQTSKNQNVSNNHLQINDDNKEDSTTNTYICSIDTTHIIQQKDVENLHTETYSMKRKRTMSYSPFKSDSDRSITFPKLFINQQENIQPQNSTPKFIDNESNINTLDQKFLLEDNKLYHNTLLSSTKVQINETQIPINQCISHNTDCTKFNDVQVNKCSLSKIDIDEIVNTKINSIKDEFDQAYNELLDEVYHLKSTIKELKQTHKTEIDSLHTEITGLKESLENLKETPTTKNRQKEIKQQENRSLSSIINSNDNQQPNVSTSNISNSIHANRSEVKKSFDLKNLINPIPTKSKVETNSTDTYDSDSSTEEETNRLPFIPNTISTLILGDSIVRGIHDKKMNINDKRCKVISISGMDKTVLADYLYNTPPNPNITNIIVHVGINDIKRGHVITKSTWKRTIKQLKINFPNATISMSSILPYSENHPTINKITDETNENLELACEELQVKIINNDHIFFTANNDLKTGWYRDPIHPNKRGTSGLAVHYKKHVSQLTTPKLLESKSEKGTYSTPIHISSNRNGFDPYSKATHTHLGTDHIHKYNSSHPEHTIKKEFSLETDKMKRTENSSNNVVLMSQSYHRSSDDYQTSGTNHFGNQIKTPYSYSAVVAGTHKQQTPTLTANEKDILLTLFQKMISSS